jgi:hypothetical protein
MPSSKRVEASAAGMEINPVAKPYTPSTPAVRHSRFLPLKEWRTGEYLSLAALGLMFVSVLGLNWVTVDIEAKDPLFGVTLINQSLKFKVTENGTLAAGIIALLVLALLFLPWRRPLAWSGLFFWLLLAGCFAYYLYGLVDQAYDILGLLKAVPIFGSMLVELAKDSIKAVRPQPGFYLFAAGDLALLAGSILRLRRR